MALMLLVIHYDTKKYGFREAVLTGLKLPIENDTEDAAVLAKLSVSDTVKRGVSLQHL